MKLITKALAVTATLALAGAAMGANYSVDPIGAGLWCNANSWLVGGVHPASPPGQDDVVTLDYNMTLVSGCSANAEQITVNQGVTLLIQGNATLTLNANGNNTSHSVVQGTIDLASDSNGNAVLVTSSQSGDYVAVDVDNFGLIYMEGTSGVPSIALNTTAAVRLQATTAGIGLIADAPTSSYARFYGTGSLRGEYDNVAIDINAGVSPSAKAFLRLDGPTIQGRLKIEDGGAGGGSVLDNRGSVIADASAPSGAGTITLDTNLSLADVSGAKWKVAAQNAMLEFKHQQITTNALVGDFVATASANFAIMRFRASVTTSGAVDFGHKTQWDLYSPAVFTSTNAPTDPCSRFTFSGGVYTLTGAASPTSFTCTP